MILESGAGTGFKAEVDDTFKLKCRSTVEFGSAEASANGRGFIVTSGTVTLTSASASAVLWFQNEDNFDLLLDSILFTAGVSTGGTAGSGLSIASKLNPTGLGSGSSSEALIINSNLGSSNTLISTSSEIGQEAATITGGTNGPSFHFEDRRTTLYPSQVFIPKGTGLAFTVQPMASNTSIAVSLGLRLHRLVSI